MFVAIPKPLVSPVHKRALISGQQVADQHGFVQPCGQNPVQHDQFQAGLVNAEGFEIRLVVKATGGIVVRGRVAGCDVERHVEAACNFIENFAFEFRVSASGLNDWQQLVAFSNA